MSSVRVAYRIAPTRNLAVRPAWFSQRVCLESFASSVAAARRNGISIAVDVFVDGELADKALDQRLNEIGVVHRSEAHGNSATFRNCFDAALDAGEEESYVLLAEDDYLWLDNAITDLVLSLGRNEFADYASPYDHPYTVGVEAPYSVSSGWKPIQSTTMTFLARRSALVRDRHIWWLATFGQSPKDWYGFRCLTEGRCLKLIGNAGARDIRRLMNMETMRLVWRSATSRIVRIRRVVLLAPTVGRATHAHEPYLSPTGDWAGRAADF